MYLPSGSLVQSHPISFPFGDGAPRRTVQALWRRHLQRRRLAEPVVLRLFQSTAWSEHDERRRVADFEALDHDLRAAIGIAVRDASAQTTADDERDALGLAAETLERLAALV